jgi:hypothetical protein
MREAQQRHPFANEKGTGPIFHKPGTKPARRAKKFEQEMARKHSKQDLMKAHKHMEEHKR